MTRPDLGSLSKNQNRDRKDGRQPRQQVTRVEAGPDAPTVPKAVETRKPRREKGEAPKGYRQDIWSLAILFTERAYADGITLAHDLPVIYHQLKDLIEAHGIERQQFRHEIDGCARRTLHSKLAAHCWLHYPPLRPADQKTGTIGWVEMMEVIILEFWSHVEDEYALDYFRQRFVEIGQQAVSHWASLRQVRAIRENPKPVQPRMRRATMPDVSKEGQS